MAGSLLKILKSWRILHNTIPTFNLENTRYYNCAYERLNNYQMPALCLFKKSLSFGAVLLSSYMTTNCFSTRVEQVANQRELWKISNEIWYLHRNLFVNQVAKLLQYQLKRVCLSSSFSSNLTPFLTTNIPQSLRQW